VPLKKLLSNILFTLGSKTRKLFENIQASVIIGIEIPGVLGFVLMTTVTGLEIVSN
jgi:hypothetical protein